jgi:VanZ family protein
MSKLVWLILSLLWAALTWRLTTTPNLVVAPDNLLNTLMMMGGHFVFFGLQAVLLSPLTRYAVPLTSSYGLLIELVQLSVPGRSADPMDWILDTLGAITFLAILNKLKTQH